MSLAPFPFLHATKWQHHRVLEQKMFVSSKFVWSDITGSLSVTTVKGFTLPSAHRFTKPLARRSTIPLAQGPALSKCGTILYQCVIIIWHTPDARREYYVKLILKPLWLFTRLNWPQDNYSFWQRLFPVHSRSVQGGGRPSLCEWG